MKDWAKRIELLLGEQKDQGKSEAGLARACKIKPNSLAQWFGRVKGKPATGTLKVESALLAARYLGTTPEWIILGEGSRLRSQDLDLDPETLGQAFVATEKAARGIGVEYDAAQVPELLIWAYKARPRFKPGRDKDVLAQFDRLVKDQLEWEMGRDNRASRSNAVQSGGENAQAPTYGKEAGGSQ